MRSKRLALRTRFRVLLSPFSLGVLLVIFRFRALPRPRFLETEAPEVHEVSLGEPSLLRKEHELEVVEHDCAHEFSEACSDFEFFPERPKAFRKLWHGVSMFELVRKPCSLNFGMLGLFWHDWHDFAPRSRFCFCCFWQSR